MGIYKTIKDNEIYMTFHKGMDSDSLSYFDVNEAIIHFDTISDGLEQTTGKVSSAEELLDYFATLRLASFSSYVSKVEDTNSKNKLVKLVEKATTVKGRFDIGSIIKFVNLNFADLIESKENGYTVKNEDQEHLFYPMVEFCAEVQGGISNDVFETIAEREPHVFIMYFDRFKKILHSTKTIFEKAFSKENIKAFIRTKCVDLLEIGKKINENCSSEELKSIFNDNIYKASIMILQNITDNDMIIYMDSMRRINRFLVDVKYDSTKLKSFADKYEEFDNKSKEQLLRTSKSVSYEIPPEIASIIFDSKVNSIDKLLSLTHKITNLKSQFVFHPKHASFADRVSHNIDTDDYFTYSRQTFIKTVISVGISVIANILPNEEYLSEFYGTIIEELKLISNICNVDAERIIDDFIASLQSLQYVSESNHQEYENYNTSLIYGSCMLTIACIEKLLRLVYKYESNIYISDKLIQLHGLLDNGLIKNVISEDLMKSIGFYLSKYDYIGMDYRNKLAHLSGISINEIRSEVAYACMYLYICLINSVYIFYDKECQKA